MTTKQVLRNLAALIFVCVLLVGCGDDSTAQTEAGLRDQVKVRDQRIADLENEIKKRDEFNTARDADLQRVRDEYERSLRQQRLAFIERESELKREVAALTIELSGYKKIEAIGELVRDHPERMERAGSSSMMKERIAYVTVVFALLAALGVTVWQRGEKRDTTIDKLADVAANLAVKRPRSQT